MFFFFLEIVYSDDRRTWKNSADLIIRFVYFQINFLTTAIIMIFLLCGIIIVISGNWSNDNG